VRARPAHAALDRADRAFADGGGFREAQPVGPDQQHRLALLRGQLRQRMAEVHGDGPSVLVGRGGRPLEMVGSHDFAACTLLPVDVHEPVPQNRGQPSAEIRALLELTEMRPRAEQRVLHEIVGLLSAAAQ
jgi:hypothetical protein